ncbi:MAG: S9 family peptidase [Proteobacteria bacterium]|nr:S9 family peptidase [Pseudomonadota bacterium]
MKSWHLLAPACAALLLAPPPAAWAADTPQPPNLPLRDFFANPPQSNFQLSGDGRWLSWMEPAPAAAGATPRLNVFVQALDGARRQGQPRQLSFESARDVDGYFWKGGDTLLYAKDFGGDENYHVIAVNPKDGQITDLTPYDGVRAGVVDVLEDDPEHLLLMHNRRDKKTFDVYRVHVRSGKETLVATNPGTIDYWLTDHAGRLRAAYATVGTQKQLLWRASEEDAFKPIIETDYKTTVAPLFFDFDNQRLYLSSNRGRDLLSLVRVDPTQPGAEEVIFQPPGNDLTYANYSRARKVLTEAQYEGAKRQQHYFDAQTERLYHDLEKRLPGYRIDLQASTRAEDRHIVSASSDRTPGVRYLYDSQRGELTQLAVINARLPEAQMAQMKPISYTARDGLVITGYLTLPVGRTPKNLACIVNPHGGPWARDSLGFKPEVQFLANRGYCVLQMNFRGSTGYGRTFWEASFGQWGLAMQDDITDGARWLVAQGIADPKRLGIYGGSYGGYATLAGITTTPDLYAAAVDYVGVSNLLTFMGSIPPYWESWRQQLYAMVGDPNDPVQKKRLEATSPALHADKIKTPLLVVQGAKDPRVKQAESDQMVEALRKRGVAVEYMVKDNEGHGFANEENRFEFYGAMERFFGQHLKP